MTALGVAINEYGICKKLTINNKQLAGGDDDQNKLEAVTIKPGVENLKECWKDIDRFENMLYRFSFVKEQIHRLNDPTRKELDKLRLDIKRPLDDKPDETHLIIVAIAGHGITYEGRQTIVINTFNVSKGFYELWKTEEEIRM